MQNFDDGGDASRKILRRIGAPIPDPLGEVLNRLAEQERDEIAEIVRREIVKESSHPT